MKDAAREFLNIIMGTIKRHYSSGNPFDISVPTIIIGGDYLVYTKARKDDNVSLIDFNYNGNFFCVEIYLK
jgi:CheY-specific phosphatase CheX